MAQVMRQFGPHIYWKSSVTLSLFYNIKERRKMNKNIIIVNHKTSGCRVNIMRVYKLW